MVLSTRGLQGVVLHIPASLRARATSLANQECLSLNLFIASAVAEKIHRLEQERRVQPKLKAAPTRPTRPAHQEDVLLCAGDHRPAATA